MPYPEATTNPTPLPEEAVVKERQRRLELESEVKDKQYEIEQMRTSNQPHVLRLEEKTH